VKIGAEKALLFVWGVNEKLNLRLHSETASLFDSKERLGKVFVLLH
jgi:hypothetical protein